MKDDKENLIAGLVWLGIFIFNMTWMGTLIYVAYHFINKYWQ